jgi:hypothetical protein
MSKAAPILIGVAPGAILLISFGMKLLKKIQSNGKNVYNYKMV